MAHAGERRITVLKGNLERLVNWYLTGEPVRILKHFGEHRHNLFAECMAEQGLGPVTGENYAEMRRLFAERYADVVAFCAELPNALETEDLVFVHAGLGACADWRASTEQEVMKNDPFLKTGVNTTGKWLVAGHMPTWNSPLSKNSNNCIVDRERRCAFIDGGNQVKGYAQLNALILEKRYGTLTFRTVFESDYPSFTAAESYTPDRDLGCFKDDWPDVLLTMEEPGEDFSRCRRTDGSLVWVNNAHMGTVRGQLEFTKNTVSTLLPVRAGERLELLDAAAGRYVFVRNRGGFLGWAPRSVLG
jgi:hypothetical protein